MIIEYILDGLVGLFSLLTSPINIPTLPDSVVSVLDGALSWIDTGIGIVHAYTNFNYLITLFGIVIGIDIAITLYHFIMWILKKIPMLGIE